MGRKKSFKREEVIEKATQLFWKMGFAKTNLQELEKATGLNKSSLYSEFDDKEDLFHSCIRQYSETNGAREILSRAPLGLKNIEDLLTQESNPHKMSGCFIANSLRETAILPKKTKNFIMEHMIAIHSLVFNNLEAGGIHKQKAKPLCELILTLNAGMALRANIQVLYNRKQIVREFFEVLFDKNSTRLTF